MLPDQTREFVGRSPIHRAPIAGAVAEFAASLPTGSEVLDAGAGDAPYRPLFAHCAYRTQDWAETVHPGGRSADIIGDLHELDVPDASFDAIVLTEVLEHVAEPGRVLAELSRLLRPAGRLLVTVPFVIELHEDPHDHYRYTSYGLRGLLERAGFESISVEPLTGWFSTVAQVLRHQGMSVAPADTPATFCSRAVSFGLLLISRALARVAPALDRRFDHRRALPIGWVALASRPSAETTP